ncbi:TrkH family potassium uptake protein [Haliscomenobacter hydrossis]|uniref:H(+)-transporting two-sector ATPase n=1 Tax=Haliscomenobacter hydrossis (strain ATCC 27775 / DSM 1100 / LMG 10767 / O) TaxID=760192 RepID=F4L4X9_HALH1|nr:potassium transporter TrkG [Haliscomenobacter hydrossis]AEE54041.1 H(+)-transporting two-sector ATPase [Haliscomenobacter hydrossis DSM 1100]
MWTRRVIQLFTLSALGLVIYDFGFTQDPIKEIFLLNAYFFLTLAFTVLESYRLYKKQIPFTFFYFVRLILPFTAFTVIAIDWIVQQESFRAAVMRNEGWFFANILLLVLYGMSNIASRLYRRSFSPAVIFVSSFMIVIFFGTLFLMLPNATNNGIRFIDAIFTITSAVSVTGLAVVDTRAAFTTMGQTIILVCIQLGGLGMLTLTAFFAYFFKGKSSYVEGLFIRDFLSSDQFEGLLGLAMKIVFLTFGIELTGAFLIYINLPQQEFRSFFDMVFFCVFHSVSAFCNAGFSTLTNGLYEAPFRFNYNIHLTIAFLIIIGGLGFSIMFNLFILMKHTLTSWYKHFIVHLVFYRQAVRVATLNTRVVIFTTVVLLIVGTIAFAFFEWNGVMQEHKTLWGKFVTAFFGSVTPRTAGFNTVNMTELSRPTILVTILFMWIGASPASTGGGIKTSTFAIAIMNIFAVVRSKPRIEYAGREIPQDSVNRAFAIIVLSWFVIGIGFTVIAQFERNIPFLSILFECVSAYATVGLSLGITPQLSDISKITLIVVMFVGRVGAITILIGLIKDVDCKNYRYPRESVLIN